MALDFPASPSINQKHTEGGITWTWDGTTWRVLGKFQSSSSLVESDPIFAASPAANIVLQNITHWNTAYSWGNHATAGYKTSVSLLGLTDVEITPPGGAGFLPLDEGQFLEYINGKWRNVQGISTNDLIWAGGGIQIEKLGGGYTQGLLSFMGGAGISIGYGTNPTGTAGQVITADGNGGIQWSNTSITETDPVFTTSPAGGITAANIANWNTSYNWGNHTFANYVADSDFTSTGLMKRGATSGSYSVITDNSSNWNTAFGWGNHASAGYITGISNLSIDALNDVAITSPASGQVLSYNSSTGLWVNSAPTGGGGSGITDIVLDTTPQLGGNLDTNTFSITGGATSTIEVQGQTSKIRFHYDALGDLPSATTWHGMFAHVHDTGRAYVAHGGVWEPLAKLSDTADTNTTYSQSSVASGSNVNLRLTGSDTVTDDILLTAGTGITFSSVTANGFTISSSVGSTNLDSLTDVVISSPANGQIILYNGTSWINTTPSYLTSTGSIDSHTDVTITSATTGQILQYNGSQWVNSNPTSSSGLTSRTTAFATASNLSSPASTTYTYGVTANSGNTSNYVFSGSASGSGPTLNVAAGDVLVFNVNVSGSHPFWVKTAQVTGTGSGVGNGTTTGTITNNGASNATITWNTAGVTPGTYYYICQAHSNMYGVINVAAGTTTSATGNISIVTPKTYALLKIQTSHAAWVTLYTDSASRTADATRSESTDPLPGSGVIAEVITTAATTQIISPGTIGYNNDTTPTGTTYAKVVNKTGAAANITVTLTYVQLEA